MLVAISADKRLASDAPRAMPKTKKLCHEPLRPEPARLTPTESGNAQGSGDALLARLEHGKLPGFSCSINRSHQPPVWACDSCERLRCAACLGGWIVIFRCPTGDLGQFDTVSRGRRRSQPLAGHVVFLSARRAGRPVFLAILDHPRFFIPTPVVRSLWRV